MIREATMDDVPRIVEMGHKFISTSRYARYIAGDDGYMRDLIVNIMENPLGLLLVAGDAPCIGMIGVLAFNHPMSGELVASEMFWWMEREARGQGVKLLRAAEKWARERGVRRLMMISPDDRVSEFYERLGYEKVETTFMRRFK